MSQILEEIKKRPSVEDLRKQQGPKEKVDKQRQKEEVAEIKRLSEILNSRVGQPMLKTVYIESLDCKLQFGDPSVGEFFDVLKRARTPDERGETNMDMFMFDLLYIMLHKADPNLTEDALKKRIEAVEAIDILAEIMDVSPFFKKAFSLRSSGKFSLV